MKKKKLPKNVRERDGKYYFRFSIKDPATGNRKQKETPGFATPKEAEQEGIRIQAELLQGTYKEKVKLSFSAWCEEWLKWYESTGRVKENTVAQRSDMLGVLKTQIGGLYLHEVTEDVYQSALYELDKHLSYNTLSSLHSCARMVFSRAIQKGKIKVDPTKYALIPKKIATFEEREAAKLLPRFLEKDELQQFLAAVDAPQFRRLFELMALTGMRIGELSALLISDFTEEGYLTISKTRYTPKSVKKYKLTTPKNESSERTIYLSKKAIATIKDQIAWRKAFTFSKGSEIYKERQFLFICEKSAAGYPLHRTIVADHLERALIKAELPTNLTPHSFRHTYTSLMAEAGADLDTIQAQLGHKKGSDVTRSVYLHVTKAREKRDIDRLDALLEASN
jgi:integrase